MKKLVLMLAIAVGSVSMASAGGACGSCNSCAKRYTPGQCFTTKCGSGGSCAPKCKPVCKPVCVKPCPQPCNPCAPTWR